MPMTSFLLDASRLPTLYASLNMNSGIELSGCVSGISPCLDTTYASSTLGERAYLLPSQFLAGLLYTHSFGARLVPMLFLLF